MDRIGLYAVVHWTVGLIILVMGFWGLFSGLNPLGYEPAWHAVLKILLGLLIVGVGIKFTARSITTGADKMNQIKTLGIAHLTVGLIFVLMGMWGLIPTKVWDMSRPGTRFLK
ncbi:MAG: hypothetical protein Q8N08_02835 [Methanobacteriaceae archaeon]|nr:hypothetical protein [Methanobacteriaceae archaeon]